MVCSMENCVCAGEVVLVGAEATLLARVSAATLLQKRNFGGLGSSAPLKLCDDGSTQLRSLGAGLRHARLS